MTTDNCTTGGTTAKSSSSKQSRHLMTDDFAGQSNAATALNSVPAPTSVLKSSEALVSKIEPMALRISDAVNFTSLSRTRLFQMMADGTLRRIKHGRVTLIPVADLRALVTHAD